MKPTGPKVAAFTWKEADGEYSYEQIRKRNPITKIG